MALLNNHSSEALWWQVIREAESNCAIYLEPPLEQYLVSLLQRYLRDPEVATAVIATDYLQAAHLASAEREGQFQRVGDNCLIFSGLFPGIIERKQVKLRYFVDMGRSAYHSVSTDMNDLFTHLAYRFVNLMDVLQTISPSNQLLPLEAYEQWQELGSQRAYLALESYKTLK